jgi:hypothetical protein
LPVLLSLSLALAFLVVRSRCSRIVGVWKPKVAMALPVPAVGICRRRRWGWLSRLVIMWAPGLDP